MFGSLDILPFTGVTFPFVSRGGSSMLACWMMMAFIKSEDNRKNASFAVNAVRQIVEPEDYDDDDDEYEYMEDDE